jgi:hypothetical protein
MLFLIVRQFWFIGFYDVPITFYYQAGELFLLDALCHSTCLQFIAIQSIFLIQTYLTRIGFYLKTHKDAIPTHIFHLALAQETA